MRKENLQQTGAVRSAEGVRAVADRVLPSCAMHLCVLSAVLVGVLVASEPVVEHQLQQCALLSNMSQLGVEPGGTANAKRTITMYGQSQNVTLYWNGGPTRAAASLLLVILRDVLHYTGVSLQFGTPFLCDLEPKNNELVVVPGAVLSESKRCDLNKAGVVVLHEAAAPLNMRLHVVVSEAARADATCALATNPMFYKNVSALRRCGFLDHNGELNELAALVPLFAGREEEERAVELLHRLNLRNERVGRANLTRLVLAAKRSFVFIDYEVWSDVRGVWPVPLPSAEPDTRQVAVFAASEEFWIFAPSLYDAMMDLSVKPEELRELLEAEETPGGSGRVTCARAVDHARRLSSRRHDHWIAILVCKDDPDNKLYNDIAKKVGRAIWNITCSTNTSICYGIGITKYEIDCIERAAASDQLNMIGSSSKKYRCVGAVVPAEGVEFAADAAKQLKLPLVAYGAPGLTLPGVGASAGATLQLALAVRKFIRERGWSRVAVLSEPSAPAEVLSDALQADEQLAVRAVLLNPRANNLETKQILATLMSDNARIFLVNGGWRMARSVLAAAAELNMTAERGYAWLAREWRGADPPETLRLFTISFECNATGSFADGLLSLGLGFTKLVQRTQYYRDDLRSDDAYSEFWRGFDEVNATGDCQPSLRYRDGALLDPLVFLTERTANATRRLGTWRIYTDCTNSTECIEPLGETLDPYAGQHATHDGSATCFWPRGDKFTPVCLERAVASWGGALALLLVLVSAATWVLKRRADRRRTLSLLSEEHQKRAQRERIMTTLVDKLVDREALELREEIGAGRFGRVWLAVLRAAGRRPRTVAAKALHGDADPAEVREFLREACILATLEHEHVVRLVGICATAGPILVLMEYTCFGDLERYLRARRHLAEGIVEPAEIEASEAAEAEHVSASELTRLAREAASALGYLAHRGLVHRDVRAANCLLDARRKLKLGDFGLARETCSKGTDGEAEYACQRRGMFPVLWMAPESLSRGAFSAASDVWAFGVLVFEVITLGERPYGAWPPPRVLHHVLSGGQPRLPADATAQARGLTLACWRQRAAERPTAAELVAYLAEHPRVLAPALASLDELGSVDSGFCDSAVMERIHN